MQFSLVLHQPFLMHPALWSPAKEQHPCAPWSLEQAPNSNSQVNKLEASESAVLQGGSIHIKAVKHLGLKYAAKLSCYIFIFPSVIFPIQHPIASRIRLSHVFLQTPWPLLLQDSTQRKAPPPRQ